MRPSLAAGDNWVVKFGSAVLTHNGAGPDQSVLAGWVQDLVELHRFGVRPLVVSSGAVAEGMRRLGWRKRPSRIHELQAAASMGQMGLVQLWESCFSAHGLHTGQVLLTHEDLTDRCRYLNARSTLRTLLALGAVPVINENDAVATDEIRLGDNDTLAGLVANLVEAKQLLILTDQPGMRERDPNEDPQAPVIAQAAVNDPRLDALAGGGSGELGRGGMKTKLSAARLAARSGTHTVIADGRSVGVIRAVARGEEVGTLLRARSGPVAARKQWLAGQLRVAGNLIIDAGAERVLREAGRSLLPVGVTGVTGEFRRGDLVACVNVAAKEVARGLVNYDAAQVKRIAGLSSDRFQEILGYAGEDELIHRDNLVLT